MKLLERSYFFSIEDFSSDIIAGFTKPNLKVKTPSCIKKVILDLSSSVKLASLIQLHSSKINIIKKSGLYIGDGLFTDKKNIALLVKTADCLPIFFYNKSKGIIGLIHMGWQGAVKGILDNLPYKLSLFKVVAGVGLRSCCYEVGKEFLNYKKIKPFLIKKNNFLYFDPIRFLFTELVARGLRKENFFDIGICSFCFPYKFYSFRRDKTNYRTLSFIVKK
ncbi:MAG: polyphenol oxidase family protein [Candidatus Omnitrophica bacterium]|nr:polyphenol oxidase family protein [Candidatus Omnitrophota bacterium]